MSEIKAEIKAFVIETFLFGSDEGLEENTSFIDEGIIDSTGILELIDFLEEEYSISVEDEEMIPENLDSLNNVTTYLSKKMGSKK